MGNEQERSLESVTLGPCGSAPLFYLGVLWRLYEGELLPEKLLYSGHDPLTCELTRNCVSLVSRECARKVLGKPRLTHDFWSFVANPLLRRKGPTKNHCGRPKVSLSLRNPCGSEGARTEVIGLDQIPKTVNLRFDLAPRSLNDLSALCTNQVLTPIERECLIDLAFVLTDMILRESSDPRISDRAKQIVVSPNRLFYLTFDKAMAAKRDGPDEEPQLGVAELQSPEPQPQALAAGAK